MPDTTPDTTPDTVPTSTLTLDGARKVLDAALAAADVMGKAFCITVADPSGEPIATARMDGAPRLAASIAANKAYTVAGFGGQATADWWPNIENEPALVHGITNTPRLIVFGGGVGVFSAGALVGTIGVSGASAEEDAEVAAAGAAVIA